MEHLWSASTLVGAVAGALGASAVPWPFRSIWRLLRGQAVRDAQSADVAARREDDEIVRLTARVGDLEDLVDLLRKALDKHLMRESAIASACELLIALAKLVPKPSPAMLHFRDRAQHLLEEARAHTVRIDQGRRK